VELLEQGIKVSAKGAEIGFAEAKVGALFKKEAERYHAERGSEVLIIKDSGAITTDNASKFLDFYKVIRPGIFIEVDAQGSNEGKTKGKIPHRVQIKINSEPIGELVEMSSKKKAEDTAFLTAAIALKMKEPEIYPRYIRALKSGNGQILKPVSPVDMPVDEDCSLVMRETLLGARKAGLPDEVEETVAKVDTSETQRGVGRRQLTAEEAQRRNWNLKERFDAYQHDPSLTELRNKRGELPMNQYKAKVLDLVNNNVYSIIVGATGSGKTTQVPQILLEEAIAKGQGAKCNIVCTQPRRIAAISVARRVAVERSERLQESIGYHVRFDAKLPKMGGSVNYCTTGILQQQLQHHPDDVMNNVSHLVVDEVHERDMLIDFLLIMLKKNVMRRRAQGKTVPQIVLMSATMDTELFASYFKSDIPGQGLTDCPSLSVPGRTFPVKERYLDEIVGQMRAASPMSELKVMHTDPDSKDFLQAEDHFRAQNPISKSQETSSVSTNEAAVIDWKRERTLSADGTPSAANEKEDSLIPFGLTACTIAHIAKTSQEGAILVFLPGLAELVKVDNLLKTSNFGVNFNDGRKFNIFMLHSSISASQNTVFEPVPEGCRKIILATNIAETSVTIPDVQYVVDTGKLREKQYDQTRRISSLVCTWISKSNAKQRAGRAGRVQNGNYYALYTKERYEGMRAIGLPELLRVDLQEICLKIKSQAFQTPIRDFLAEAIEPPSAKAVDTSVIDLQALDAITDDERITPLGRLLSALPVHPTLGKMIVLGIIFRCLDPMLILGAASAERSLFLNPLDARNEAQEAKLSFVEGSGSDHIALLNAVRELRGLRDQWGEHSMKQFAHLNFLHANAFKTIDATATQIETLLVDAGLIPFTAPYNRSSSQLGSPSLNENSHKVPLIKALALAGFHPNLAVNQGGRVFRTPGEKAAIVHPSSVNAPRDRQDNNIVKFGSLYTYGTMSRSNDGRSIFLRDTTEATPLMATLFGGKLKRNEERGSIIELDNWLPFYVSSNDRRTAKTIIEFRKALERLLATAFNDLGNASKRDREGMIDGSRGFLADEKVRELFAGGLVDVLDRDVRTAEAVAKRGWSGGVSSSGTRRVQKTDGRMPNGRDAKVSGRVPGYYEDTMKF
jgi:ATP-dependent RNA helicase DHX36